MMVIGPATQRLIEAGDRFNREAPIALLKIIELNREMEGWGLDTLSKTAKHAAKALRCFERIDNETTPP